MDARRIEYKGLLYEIISDVDRTVSLVEPSGFFANSARYGHYSSSVDTTILHIPETIEDDSGKQYTVTAIGKSSLDNAIDLREIHIPRTVKSIEWGFWDCRSLSCITVHPENPVYCDKGGVLYTKDGKTLVAYPNDRGYEYSVAKGTERIGKFAFKMTFIEILTFPSSVRVIDTNALYRCTHLRSVYVNGRRPLEIKAMVGDYGEVNPVFHYRSFSAKMDDAIHHHNERLINYGGRFVYDVDTCKYGALMYDGEGYIGDTFDELNQIDDVFFYGIDNVLHTENPNKWFHAERWGAVTAEGSVITPARYLCFEKKGRWLLGLSSGKLQYDETDKGYYTHCVYDLYNIDSHSLVVGGITDIETTENSDIILIRLLSSRGPLFAFNVKSNKSVLRMPDGEQLSLCHGDNLYELMTYIKKEPRNSRRVIKEEYETLLSWGISPEVYQNYSIFESQDKKGQFLVRNSDGEQSGEYYRLIHICGDCFYTCSPVVRSYAGLEYAGWVQYYGAIINGKEVISTGEGFYLLTCLRNNYFFGAKELNETTSRVFLIHSAGQKLEKQCVISSIRTTKLSELLLSGKLEHNISIDGKIHVQDASIFDIDSPGLFETDSEMGPKDDDHPMRFFRYWRSFHPRIMNASLFED